MSKATLCAGQTYAGKAGSLRINPLPVSWRGLAHVICAALLATLWSTSLLSSSPLHAAEPGPQEVIGYVQPDMTGPSKSWKLAADQPYLYVPYVGGEVAGAVAAIKIGRDIGVALFQRPFFASRDGICALDVGDDGRPDLKWLGATARFELGGGQSLGDSGPDPRSGGYASLIVYRKEIGPPPGILLLQRRRILGTRCPTPSHSIFYNRMFVPMAAPPSGARCFDLAGAYNVGGAKDMVVNFTRADRAVLMSPADLSDRYARGRHRFTVTLFTGLGCAGDSVSFKSSTRASGPIRLGDYSFRAAARSLVVNYESGPLVGYLPPPASAAPEPKAMAATTGQETAQPTASTPEVIQPAQAEPEVVQPAPSQAVVVQPQSAPTAKTTAKIVETPSAPAVRAPTAVQQAMPKLEPKIVPQVGSNAIPASANQAFQYPVHEIYRLNYCLTFGKGCGEPAANAWCKTQGFNRASKWMIDENIGSLFPTIVIGENRVCSQFVCDGFQEITCAK